MEDVPRSALGNPKNVYLGIAENPTQAKACFDGLVQLGVAKDKVTLYSGPDDKEAFVDQDMSVGDLGEHNKGFRGLFAADEVAREGRYHEAIEKGEFVMQIEVDSSEETTRDKVEEILRSNNIKDVTYFGPRTFETVASE